MATFGDITTKVSKRLLDPNRTAVSSSDVADAVNESIAYWKFRNLGFNQVNNTGTLTLTYGSGTVPEFSDFLVPVDPDGGFFIYYSQSRYPLDKISKDTLDNLYMDNGYGMPQFYNFQNRSFNVYPLPDKAYQIGGNYLKNYAPLVDDDDTNDFTNYAEGLIRLWTLRNLMFEFRQDVITDKYQERAMDEYRNLRVLSDKQQSTGRLTLDSCLM